MGSRITVIFGCHANRLNAGYGGRQTWTLPSKFMAVGGILGGGIWNIQNANLRLQRVHVFCQFIHFPDGQM
jgi:hypothetical protein